MVNKGMCSQDLTLHTQQDTWAVQEPTTSQLHAGTSPGWPLPRMVLMEWHRLWNTHLPKPLITSRMRCIGDVGAHPIIIQRKDPVLSG